ncbi:hypothetical protein Golomagni_02390 [Golovinomyces magnicellulatus]|nr:hypothetical protein Golomagni_02390 [Golovinomyces magnicellulatus]
MISEYRGKEFSVAYHSSYQNPTPGYGMIPTTSPQLTASYVPGRDGDINMPEVISPLPQRIMPEVPSNIQDGLAHLELETSHPWSPGRSSKNFSLKSPPIEQNHHRQQMRDTAALPGYEYTNQSIYQSIDEEFNKLQRTGSIKFTPFPRTRFFGPKVPLSDDEKGELLERVRRQILKSTNPEVQLAWAQNALLWVDIENEHAIRTATENQHTRAKTPKLEHQLREDAVNIIRHLGEQGHPKAEFIKAYWLEFGKFGYGMDKKESFLGYTRAAEKGFARAHYRIGMQYENSNNPTKALEHYKRGVSMRDSASHYRLGMMTLLGQHGTTLDYSRGVNLLRFAAETADENSPQGAYVYGMLIARELPKVNVSEQYLPYDIKEAKKYIEKSAYLGFPKAQVKMGLAYELCQLGCEFDPTLSLHYNALASRQGEAAADMAISKWFLCGYEGLFEKNEELAFLHAQRAAITQLPMAEFAMGYFYEIGMYVISDLHESENWYQKAAEHGNVDAIGRINSLKANNALSRNYHEQIAVKRIKSRYGSQRGERPDRFRKQPPSIPKIEGEIASISGVRNSYGSQSPTRKDIADPQKSYTHPLVKPNMGEVRNSYPGPTRQESSDPNMHDGSSGSPVSSSKNSTNRPVSMAPYPINDNVGATYSGNLRQGLNVGPQSDRPHSAFGIRPPLNSLKTDVQIHGQSLRSCSEIRPSTSIGSRLSDGGRVGNVEEQMMPTTWENQQIELQSPTSNNKNPQGRRYEYGPEVASSNRLNKSVSSINMKSPRISHHPGDYHGNQSTAKHDQAPIRLDSIVNQSNRPERLSSANIQQAQQNSNRLSQRPPQQNISPQQGHQPRVDSRASSRPLPSPPVTSPKTSGPKKTGPATFEEMGIPAANKEGECTIM